MEDDHIPNGAVLPAQYFGQLRIDASQTPTGRLAYAVLMSAVNDYQYHANAAGRATRKNWHDAATWLFGGQEGAFTFDFVCQVLGIEPNYLRPRLRAWNGHLPRSGGVRRANQLVATRVRVRR